MAAICGAGTGRARQRDLEGQEQRLADRRWCHVGDRYLRRRQQPADLGHRQSGADVRRHLSARRQPLHQQRDLLESRRRQDELVLPVHARRPLGLRRSRHPHPDRWPGRGPAAPAHHPFRPQRLPLHDGAQQRTDAAGQALSREHQLDEGHRPEDRQAFGIRPQCRHAALCGRGHAHGTGAHQADVPEPLGRQQFLARQLQPEDQAALYPDRDAVHGPYAAARAQQRGRRLERWRLQADRALRI